MKFHSLTTCAAFLCLAIYSCSKPDTTMEPDQVPPAEETSGFVEAIPDTIEFTNAQFIYNGDDMGDASSDGWVIKLYTDMEIDETGSPVGPGHIMQMLLNVRYDSEQSANPDMLRGSYIEMVSSGDFREGTFVDGYMARIDLPTGMVEIPDATFYAEIKDGSTEMDCDLIDEGIVRVSKNDDGTFLIEGILVGKKYTKRYFTWTGAIEAKNEAPEIIPNSTLKEDMIGLSFVKGQIQDKGDPFFLRDESYRNILIYLAEESIRFTQYRPEGNGAILRLEVLVPWETDINKDGIPAGTYTMVQRNENGSIDRELIVPGNALTGLPDVFEAWKLSGSWYYELSDAVWTSTYARINGGTITISRGDDGSHTISYDLTDCQKSPKRISGRSTLILETI